eukprot:13766432-Alexandrium_andersonii.AAC.1
MVAAAVATRGSLPWRRSPFRAGRCLPRFLGSWPRGFASNRPASEWRRWRGVASRAEPVLLWRLLLLRPSRIERRAVWPGVDGAC